MLNIIATFILIYLIFRLVITYVIPWIARWYVRRYRKRFYRDNPGAARAAENRKTTHQHTGGKQRGGKTPDTDKIGEYVDFEEIREENAEDKQPE